MLELVVSFPKPWKCIITGTQLRKAVKSEGIFKVFPGSLLHEGHAFDNKDLRIIWPVFVHLF